MQPIRPFRAVLTSAIALLIGAEQRSAKHPAEHRTEACSLLFAEQRIAWLNLYITSLISIKLTKLPDSTKAFQPEKNHYIQV